MSNGSRGGIWMFAGLAGLVAGAAGVGAAGSAAHEAVATAMHGMGGHDMAKMDPAAMDAHLDAHLAKMVPDATPEQTARLKALARAVHADLGAIHAQMETTHKGAHALLLAPTIDRAGLEKLRVEQLRVFDQRSKHMLASIEEAAAVLTPEQRQRFAAQMQSKPR